MCADNRCFFSEVRDALQELVGACEELDKALRASNAMAPIIVYSFFQDKFNKAVKLLKDCQSVCDICGASNCISDHK